MKMQFSPSWENCLPYFCENDNEVFISTHKLICSKFGKNEKCATINMYRTTNITPFHIYNKWPKSPNYISSFLLWQFEWATCQKIKSSKLNLLFTISSRELNSTNHLQKSLISHPPTIGSASLIIINKASVLSLNSQTKYIRLSWENWMIWECIKNGTNISLSVAFGQ